MKRLVLLACIALTAASCTNKDDSLLGPSQSPAEARRDQVTPALAAVPLADRLHREVRIRAAEGSWLLSELPQKLRDQSVKHGCRLGDICTIEYGEILLVTSSGVRRAYPFPEIPPRWMALHRGFVYAGAIGDGGLPSSSLLRINRTTFSAEVIVFPSLDEPAPPLLPNWRLATAAESARYRQLDDGTTTPVHSGIGPLSFDLDAVDAFFAR